MSRDFAIAMAIGLGLTLGWIHHLWVRQHTLRARQNNTPAARRENLPQRKTDPFTYRFTGVVLEEGSTKPIANAAVELFELSPDDFSQRHEVAFAASVKEDEFGVHENLGVMLGALPSIPVFSSDRDAGAHGTVPTLLIEEKVFGTRSDDRGRFELRWQARTLTRSNWRLLASASGYAPAFSKAMRAPEFVTITLRRQAVASDPQSTRTDSRGTQPELRGRIVEDPSGAAVAGAHIAVQSRTYQTLTTAISDNDGSFTAAISQDAKQLELTHPSFAKTIVPLDATTTSAGPRVFRLAKGGVLRGVVFDRFGAPIAHALVFLDQGATDTTAFKTQTNARGQFEFGGVPQGYHMLYTSHARAGAVAQSVRAWAGQTVSRITVHLPDRQ